VIIDLTLAALNDLEVKMADIENTYLTAPITEKVWTILGPEVGADYGIVRDFYGINSGGATFMHHLAECMKNLGCSPCLADGNLSMKDETHPEDRAR
jgi:hypothetical protein